MVIVARAKSIIQEMKAASDNFTLQPKPLLIFRGVVGGGPSEWAKYPDDVVCVFQPKAWLESQCPFCSEQMNQMLRN